MREKKFIKEELKQVKKQKKDIDAKLSQEDGIARDRNGEIMCCVPFMKCTRIGHPLPQSQEDGVKMCCTNPDCAYAKHLVHPECFRSLEQNLMTLITSKGYDKSLSEKLRISEERLWAKKGLALIQKNLKCVCGKGQMTRDNDAWEEREKKYGPRVEEKEKKHKTKTSKLPTITTIVKDRAPPPHDAKKLRELETHFLSARSPPREDSYLADKYGPPLKTKNSHGNTSFAALAASKPSTVNKQPVRPKPPVNKYPIGFNPIEPKPKPPVEEVKENVVVEIKKPTAAVEKVAEKEDNLANPLSMNQSDESKERVAASLPPSNIPKLNEIILPHDHTYNSNPILKNALVQTDETSFPAALIKEPWLKMYSSKDSFDSGIASQYWKDSDSQKESTTNSNSGRSSVVQSYHGMPTNDYYNSGRSSIVQPPGFSRGEEYYASGRSSVIQPPGFHSSGNNDYYGSSRSSLVQPSPQARNNGAYDYYNSGRSSTVEPPPGIRSSIAADVDMFGSSAAAKRLEEVKKVSFIFLKSGRYGIEICHNGRKELLRNIFDNEWTPLYLSMAEKTIELGETAQYHHHEYPRHVVYDILKVIGKPLHEINRDPRWGFKVVDNNGRIGFELETKNGRRVIPEEYVMAAFFKKMKVDAENYLNDDIEEIYLSTNFTVTHSIADVFKVAAGKVHLNIEDFDVTDYQDAR